MRSRSHKIQIEIQAQVVVARTGQTHCEPVVRLMASPWQGCPPQRGSGPEPLSAPLTSECDLSQSPPYRALIRLPRSQSAGLRTLTSLVTSHLAVKPA